ncbi:type I secretion system permease/ATPase [Marinobacterium zhoushanense]|uniref:type I secretion system permease/ATPase n=1 Tax=Marinobacterium zhoushanense TaxID=1679163 RepID=UPI001664C32B|nr:type I secretion system permease/ATPase [Marinobacterium zhoushanense]
MAKDQTAQCEQGTVNDTGILCLAIVLKFHKLPSDLGQLQHQFNLGGKPVDTLSLVRAAKQQGLKAREVVVKPDRLSKVSLPAIGQNQSGQFFVLAKVTDDQVLLQRPGRAPQTLSRDSFLKEWTGTLVLATRRAGIEENARAFDLTWFIPALYKYRHIFAEVLSASFFLQLFALVSPLFFQVVVDKVLVHGGLTTLDVLVIGLLGITLFEVVLGGLRTYIFSHTTSRVDVELGTRLFRHLLSLPLNYFGSRPIGQTVARVRELETIRDFLTGSALTVVLDLLFTFVFLGVMHYYSPTLTWVVLGAIPFYIALSLLITPVLRRRVEEKFQRGATNQSFLVESVAGIETLKSMAVEPQMRRHWEEQLAAYVKSSFRAMQIGLIGNQGVALINKLVATITLWVGARLVIDGDISVGQLIAFNMLAGQVNGPILRLAQLWQQFQQMRIAIDRLGDVLDCPREAEQVSRTRMPPIKGEVRFEYVTFRYKADGPEILRNLSFSIPPGKVVGVVGRSGSGKSTLTKLVQRLYMPQSGRVLVDGVDLTLVDPAWLRRQVGVVLQDSMLFNRTVRENIALADPSLSMERIVHAAHMAGAHDFILGLPQGYDTVLEERGSNLSGGQRQRIAIARALVTDPRILIFDEATSALDYESERIIQENMKQICRGRTVIVVAHRLSAVRQADCILVMDKGILIEAGDHQELIQQQGVYAHLHRQQAA